MTPTLSLRDDRREQVLRILDPRDGSEVGQVPAATRSEAEGAVIAARAAQPAWGLLDSGRRGSLLRQAAAGLDAKAEEIAELVTRETGRPDGAALEGVRAGVETLRRFAELGPLHASRSLSGERLASDYIRMEPRGVVVALTPWNDPVAVACEILGAALVTGNTVLHKPSECCPHTGLALGSVLADQLPPGVLQTLAGGSAVGSLLVADPLVDVVAHVGSTAAGRVISRIAAFGRVHTILENGGNDAMIVDAGVDSEWAAEQIATGAFANSGQLCTAVERVYLHREAAADVITALVRRAEELNRMGALGPLVGPGLRERVHAQVVEAVARGARLLVGGEVPPGRGSAYPATVLLGCSSEMSVMREETFGPVAPVQIVNSFAEAVTLADADRYGLAATVLTPSIAHAELAISRLQVGTVKINAVFGGAPGGSAMPRRDSGRGYGYGPGLLDEMTMAKVVHLASPGPAPEGTAV